MYSANVSASSRFSAAEMSRVAFGPRSVGVCIEAARRNAASLVFIVSLLLIDARGKSGGRESDADMAAVAERLAVAGATAAKPRACHPGDNASRAAGDFQIAAYLQRAVGLRIDGERPIAHRQHLGLGGGRFAARAESRFVMRTIAEGFALRRAAAAERQAVIAAFAVQTDIAAHRIGPRFAQCDQIDR